MVVSKNQLEYALKLCNQYGKTLAVNYKSGEHADLIIDNSEYKEIHQHDVRNRQVLVDPGVKISALNEQLASSQVALPLRRNATVEQAIQEDLISLLSLRHGFFNSNVTRVGIIKGNGEPIQTGGNQVSDNRSYGFNLTQLVIGSQYQLGILYEALLKTSERDQSQGLLSVINLPCYRSTLEMVFSQWQEYADKQLHQVRSVSQVDGLVLKNSGDRELSLIAHSFSVRATECLHEVSPDLTLMPTTIDELQTKLSLLDGTIGKLEFVLPVSKGAKCLGPYADFIGVPDHHFQAHLLPDRTVYITLYYDCESDEELLEMDKLTSSVIRYGGTLRPCCRPLMDKISPFLAKRITGEGSLPLQEQLKTLFDPNDVLLSGQMFPIRENQSKSFLTKAKE